MSQGWVEFSGGVSMSWDLGFGIWGCGGGPANVWLTVKEQW